jgi:hypothetical protein
LERIRSGGTNGYSLPIYLDDDVQVLISFADGSQREVDRGDIADGVRLGSDAALYRKKIT